MLLSCCERLTDFFHQPMWPSGNKKVLVHLRITNSHFYVSFHCRYDAAWLPCCHAIPSDLFSCRNFIFAQTSRWLSREDAAAMLILVDWCIHSLFEHCKQPCSVWSLNSYLDFIHQSLFCCFQFISS